MRTRLRNMSMRHQITFLLLMMVLFMLLVQGFYIMADYRQRLNQKMNDTYDIIEQTDSLLTHLTQEMVRAGQAIATNTEVQRCLLAWGSQEEETLYIRGEQLRWLLNYMEGMADSNGNFLDIAILTNERNLYTCNEVFDYGMLAELDRRYDLEQQKQGFFATWMPTSPLSPYSTRHFAYITPIYNFYGDFSRRNEVMGYCIVWGRSTSLDAVVIDSAITLNSVTAVLDSDGEFISSNFLKKETETANRVLQIMEEYQLADVDGSVREMEYDGSNSCVLVRTNVVTGWKSVNIEPLNEVYAGMRMVLWGGMLLCFFSILVPAVIVFLVLKNITEPVAYMTETLTRIGQEGGGLRLEVHGNSEFALIGRSVNEMLDNMENMSKHLFAMREKLYRTEVLQKESEIQALQSQINPHFLYNSLECIRSIASVYKVPEIVTLSTSLAGIFRYSIQGGIHSTVQQEIACVKDYYNVMNVRYAGQVELQINVDPELLDCGMVRMSLQPLVENSISHGLEETVDVLHVRITGIRSNGYALFTVSDDGTGIAPERLVQIREAMSSADGITDIPRKGGEEGSNSIGLMNILGRIRLFYGQEYGLEVESKESEGTTIRIRVPLKKAIIPEDTERKAEKIYET